MDEVIVWIIGGVVYDYAENYSQDYYHQNHWDIGLQVIQDQINSYLSGK